MLICLNSAWGFFVALLIFSFQNMSRKTWIPMGIVAGIVTLLIVWCIANTWDPEEWEEEPVRPQGRNGTPIDSSSPAWDEMKWEVIMYYSKMFGAKLVYLPFLCFHQSPRYDIPETRNRDSSTVSWHCSVQPFRLKNNTHYHSETGPTQEEL